MLRLRLGIILIVLSWLPFAQLGLYVAHNHHDLTSEHASSVFRLSVWGLQFLIGFVGLWLAGKLAIEVVRQDGWKKTPAKLWQLFRQNHPQD